MTPGDPNQRLEELFAEALDLPATERAAFVTQRCPDDDDLVSQVLLLGAYLRTLHS